MPQRRARRITLAAAAYHLAPRAQGRHADGHGGDASASPIFGGHPARSGLKPLTITERSRMAAAELARLSRASMRCLQRTLLRANTEAELLHAIDAGGGYG